MDDTRTIDAPPDTDDGRPAHLLTGAENADLCSGCVKCCTYITIEIDPPRAAWEYDQWIWALHHRGIALYVERPERWLIHVETRCEQLGTDGRCAIHGRHPVLCREYDPRACERRLPLADIRAWFDDAEALERWLARERPAHWRQLEAWRKRSATPGAAPVTPAFIPLALVAGGRADAPRRAGRATPRRTPASTRRCD